MKTRKLRVLCCVVPLFNSKAGIDNELGPGERGPEKEGGMIKAAASVLGCYRHCRSSPHRQKPPLRHQRYHTELVGAMVWEKEVGLSHPAQKQLHGCSIAQSPRTFSP